MPADGPSTHVSLLDRVRDARDQSAWREFDARYGDLVIGYCRSCGLPLSDAEDVRQIAMASLSKTLTRFEYAPRLGRFRDYFRKVVRSAIAKQKNGRHTGREITLETGALEALCDASDREPGDDIRWEEQWVRHHYRRALAELRRTADVRSIELLERLMNGEPADRIAADLGLSAEAFRKARQRVKDRLRDIVQRQVREEDDHA